MRILHVINSLDPSHGGPTESVWKAIEELGAKGHSSEILCLDSGEEAWFSERTRGVECQVYALGPGITRYRYTGKTLIWLLDNVAQYDLLVLRGLWRHSSYCLSVAARAKKVPYVIYPHGSLDAWDSKRRPLKTFLKKIHWRVVEKRVVSSAAAVLYTSSEELRRSSESYPNFPKNGQVVAYGTSSPVVPTEEECEGFLRKYSIPTDERLLVFLGRITAKKACDNLLEAFAKTNSQSRVHLILAGPSEGNLAEKLMERAKVLGIVDRVTWTGLLAGAERWAALALADAFILPSHQENFGLAVAESLALGVPVLLSDKVYISDLVLEEQAGFVETDSEEGASKLLKTWLKCPSDEWTEMGHNARLCHEKHFTIQAAVRDFLAVAQSVIEKSKV
jgi:glycosyltransferase involved in cell wall biosynthesis